MRPPALAAPAAAALPVSGGNRLAVVVATDGFHAYPAGSADYRDGTCLQEREYQTTVVVGGKNVPAYGTACLQPDGSWKREPARLVSY